MTNAGEDKNERQWVEINEEFLWNNFINNEDMEKQTIDKRVDLEKVNFKLTEFDCQYYKKKFPYFDDSICEILEQCSIENSKDKDKQENEKTKKRKNTGLKIEMKKTIINFD